VVAAITAAGGGLGVETSVDDLMADAFAVLGVSREPALGDR